MYSILSYSQFLVTGTPWSQDVRIKEVVLYLVQRKSTQQSQFRNEDME